MFATSALRRSADAVVDPKQKVGCSNHGSGNSSNGNRGFSGEMPSAQASKEKRSAAETVASSCRVKKTNHVVPAPSLPRHPLFSTHAWCFSIHSATGRESYHELWPPPPAFSSMEYDLVTESLHSEETTLPISPDVVPQISFESEVKIPGGRIRVDFASLQQ